MEDDDTLPESVLSRRCLPLKPDPVVLKGRIVRLDPLNIDLHSEMLYSRSNGTGIDLGERHCDPYDSNELIWKYLYNGPYNNLDEFKNSYKESFASNNIRFFVVIELKSDSPVGMCALMQNNPEHLTVEIGRLWLSPIVQRTGASYEISLLLIDHIFKLGYRRCEWRCVAENIRSKQLALKIGFTFEAVHEFYMIIKNKSRDCARLRILCHEWEAVKDKLIRRLYSNQIV